MPNVSSSVLASGFGRLLALSGEPLTFRQQSVTGLVDRSAGERPAGQRPAGPGMVDFETREETSVSLLYGAVNPHPAPGEVFEDELGGFHQVLTVAIKGHMITTRCKHTHP